jgi:hypothetical protein
MKIHKVNYFVLILVVTLSVLFLASYVRGAACTALGIASYANSTRINGATVNCTNSGGGNAIDTTRNHPLYGDGYYACAYTCDIGSMTTSIANYSDLNGTNSGTHSTTDVWINITVQEWSPPTVSFGTNPVDGTNFTTAGSNVIVFDLKCADNINVSRLSFYGNWSGWGEKNSTSSPTNNTWYNYTYTLNDGVYRWGGRCNDTSNNIDWTDTNRTITVDLSGPAIVLTNPGEGDDTSCSSDACSVNFDWTATDGGSNSLNCSLYIDGAFDTSKTCTSGSSCTQTESLSSSTSGAAHYWSVNCTDHASHSSLVGIQNFTVTKTSPGGGCFLSDTLVSMGDGTLKKIQLIKVGEEIQSYDVKTNSLTRGIVKKTFEHTVMNYIIIKTLSGTLKLTENHPIYLDGNWVEAGDLKVGDVLRTQKGTSMIGVITFIEKRYDVVKVYNLEVSTGNYFASGILVHNKGGGGGGGTVTPTACGDSVCNAGNSSQTIFTCTADDDNGLKNISLYGNWTTDWHLEETKVVSGLSVEITFSKQLDFGGYIWSCLICDVVNNCTFRMGNKTITITAAGIESQSTCCKDCGCPSGKSCSNNVCVNLTSCGNGVCDSGEMCGNCITDCPCPPGQICGGNSCISAQQAVSICGNNICETGESASSCPQDCTNITCGNGKCETGESASNCCKDCGCPAGEKCADNLCKKNSFPWWILGVLLGVLVLAATYLIIMWIMKKKDLMWIVLCMGREIDKKKFNEIQKKSRGKKIDYEEQNKKIDKYMRSGLEICKKLLRGSIEKEEIQALKELVEKKKGLLQQIIRLFEDYKKIIRKERLAFEEDLKNVLFLEEIPKHAELKKEVITLYSMIKQIRSQKVTSFKGIER